MKNFAPVFLSIFLIVCYQTFGQAPNRVASKSVLNSQYLAGLEPENDNVVVTYHVEEVINSKFGSRITTYDVSHLSLVRKNDLGPNNTRTVTPRYSTKKIITKRKEQIREVKVQSTGIGMNMNNEKPPVEIKAVADALPKPIHAKSQGVVSVNITDTYERILKKGYKSVDMFKRVANTRFFDGDLVTAAKWYSELFAMTTDLEEAYYYRYAQSLKSISQLDKANEMMAVFESKSSKSN